MGDFISEDDLLTFDGFLKYQAVDPAVCTQEEIEMWRDLFVEAMHRRATAPKVGLMKLRSVPGEQKYGVAIQRDADLWLTLWVRCSPKGEVFIMYPRTSGNPHSSYHRDGTFHQKSFRFVGIREGLQPLGPDFKESEHLGTYAGHGSSSGAVCDPNAFDGLVLIKPGILGPKHGSVGVDLVAQGYEVTWRREIAPRFYFDGVELTRIFFRYDGPSLAITIRR